MLVVWGGTFDPIHNAHIELANQLVVRLSLDKLFLMPCFKAVHKNNVTASPNQRAEMIRLAIQNQPKLYLDERELQRRTASYTYDSLYELRREYKDESVNFVIGTDSLKTFPLWYRAKDIHKIANIIVVNRPASSYLCNKESNSLVNNDLNSLGFSKIDEPKELRLYKNAQFIMLELAEMNVSSTDIRQRVRNGIEIASFVDSEVNLYIQKHNLYSK